jgi:hypothetical protein
LRGRDWRVLETETEWRQADHHAAHESTVPHTHTWQPDCAPCWAVLMQHTCSAVSMLLGGLLLQHIQHLSHATHHALACQAEEFQLAAAIQDTQTRVHEALLDNINTPGVLCCCVGTQHTVGAHEDTLELWRAMMETALPACFDGPPEIASQRGEAISLTSTHVSSSYRCIGCAGCPHQSNKCLSCCSSGCWQSGWCRRSSSCRRRPCTCWPTTAAAPQGSCIRDTHPHCLWAAAGETWGTCT